MSDRASIRHATPADAEAIASLVGELGYPSTAGDVVSRLARLNDFQAAVAFIAEIDGVVAGVVTGHVFPSIHDSANVAWLTTLVVGLRYQRRGIGKYLTDAIETWARGQGAVRVSLTSGQHRDGAHAFYRELGYQYTGVRLTKPLVAEETPSHAAT
jgi:GNAT superfamily N-acetyltransferase